ncbi:unnamed protein product [Cylindrotheca closterium]|uniref:Uncharacterized protein n=1 Tax=Cylindrotheca closterium TaxID=2856 RepID=A0AAD2CKY4_9STRA|nr:unnamed protein product [Cylindrotheca closterium]
MRPSSVILLPNLALLLLCLSAAIGRINALSSENHTNRPSSCSTTRRRLLMESMSKILTATTVTTAVATTNSSPAWAAKGAAELDFEFYMRDLVGGNKREGTILPSEPLPVAPPRTLSGPLIPLLLNKECSASCIPVQALVQQILSQKNGNNSNNKDDEDKITKEIQQKVQFLREKIGKSFYTKAPWQKEEVTDQYYFDLTAYALWRTAAELLPNFVDRDQFVRRFGRLLYQAMQDQKLIPSSQPLTAPSLVRSLPQVLAVLNLFQSSNFCKGFKIRQDDSSKDDKGDPVFDDLDDESLVTSGLGVDCLVSVYEPSTLGASLQINGEQSRFGPDLVGPTLAAVWEQAGVKSAWETFFVDPEYRPNPKDYFPNEQVSKVRYSLILATHQDSSAELTIMFQIPNHWLSASSIHHYIQLLQFSLSRKR